MSIRSNPDQPQDELFRSRLENIIDMNHPLVKLGQGIDWGVFDREFLQALRRQGGQACHSNTADCWSDVFAIHV